MKTFISNHTATITYILTMIINIVAIVFLHDRLTQHFISVLMYVYIINAFCFLLGKSEISRNCNVIGDDMRHTFLNITSVLVILIFVLAGNGSIAATIAFAILVAGTLVITLISVYNIVTKFRDY